MKAQAVRQTDSGLGVHARADSGNPLRPDLPLPVRFSLHDLCHGWDLPWWLLAPWTTACQASLSFTISQSLLKFMSIESVMLSNHLILCHHPLFLLPSIFPSSRVFSNELVVRIRWPKYWSFSFSFNPSNEYSGLISFRID